MDTSTLTSATPASAPYLLNPPVLLEGFRLFLEFILREEADFLCSAPLYAHSSVRANYRTGSHARILATPLGEFPLRIQHLRYPCLLPHASVIKRAQRLSPEILESLSRIYASGVTPEASAALIKTVWTIDMPRDFHAALAERLAFVLEQWRQNPLPSPSRPE